MKILSAILALGSLMGLTVTAQVSMELTLPQDQFLPSESIPVIVKITNRSGQSLHLGVDPDWLSFSVESADGFVVVKHGDAPVIGEFDLGSSEVATKQVDVTPYFGLSRQGRYRVTATLRIKQWGAELNSPAKSFDVINGAQLWTQSFGVPVPAGMTNQIPEVRRYTLVQANYLQKQLRLYVQVSDDSSTQIFKVVAAGKMVSFSQPETQLDRFSNLHVLWQSGASSFSYVVVNPAGDLVRQDTYDNFNSRPHLGATEDGNIMVVGGVRRVKPSEIPAIQSPSPMTLPAKP